MEQPNICQKTTTNKIYKIEDQHDQEGSIKIDNKNQVSFDPLRSLKWIELDWQIHFDL